MYIVTCIHNLQFALESTLHVTQMAMQLPQGCTVLESHRATQLVEIVSLADDRDELGERCILFVVILGLLIGIGTLLL